MKDASNKNIEKYASLLDVLLLIKLWLQITGEGDKKYNNPLWGNIMCILNVSSPYLEHHQLCALIVITDMSGRNAAIEYIMLVLNAFFPDLRPVY